MKNELKKNEEFHRQRPLQILVSSVRKKLKVVCYFLPVLLLVNSIGQVCYFKKTSTVTVTASLATVEGGRDAFSVKGRIRPLDTAWAASWVTSRATSPPLGSARLSQVHCLCRRPTICDSGKVRERACAAVPGRRQAQGCPSSRECQIAALGCHYTEHMNRHGGECDDDN
ncbi:hypothetical protein PoB_000292000 [Plakobranchus ocellatus]|uniref:Uncharacterized protein n=1 Tax=Plakobranchus ocellatus TaxID=259542 RepID=A0AAV3Y002_9GAST|nr:hypothetical protein PoB_000292000 [Plakobranchus ocellatus]